MIDKLVQVRSKHNKFHYALFNMKIIDIDRKKVIFTLARDVTEEHETKKIRDELRKSQDDFISITNHELRTPLHVCLGYSEFLMKHKDEISTEKCHNIISMVHKNLQRLERLVVDVGTITHFERGIFHSEFKEIEIC